jgi:DNA-binding SARP family transcriptional activator
MPTLQVHLLGDFRLLYDGAPLTALLQGRQRLLLAFLLLHRHAPQSRQRLAFLFWPDSAEQQARNNLRQLLFRLRRTLPVAGEYFRFETRAVQWRLDAPHLVDVIEFESRLATAELDARAGRLAEERTALASAIEWYGGELLSGCYDEWILPERERLRRAYVGALERLILLAEAQRDYGDAVAHAQRILRGDPLHERTYRRLMRLHMLRGDRASAVRLYHNLVARLQRDLGVAPHVDTQEAYHRLLQSQPPARLHSSPSISPAPHFLNRQEEWKTLTAAWQRTARGESIFVLISGEPGTGKTLLAEEFLRWAGRQGIPTAKTHAQGTAAALSFAPLLDLVSAELQATGYGWLEDIWLMELAHLLPELQLRRPHLPRLAPVSADVNRQRLFAALSRALLGRRRLLIVLFDDMQECDPDTLQWLRYMLIDRPPLRLLVLCAARLEEVDPTHPLRSLLLDLRLGGRAVEVTLGALRPVDTVTLAQQAWGKPLDEGEIARLLAYTEGNPLFVVEAVRAAAQMGTEALLPHYTGFSSLEPASQMAELPPKIHDLLLGRLRRLSPQALELVGLAATIGRTFTFDLLLHASSSEEQALVRALDELVLRRIIRERGDTDYDFSHERICQLAYTQLSSARRRLHHRRVARALEKVHAHNLAGVSFQIAAHEERAGRKS